MLAKPDWPYLGREAAASTQADSAGVARQFGNAN